MISLSAGLALSAGSAFAGGENDRLDIDFYLQDEKCDDADENIVSQGQVDLEGDGFGVFGDVFGTGTDGDAIQIEYNTDLPNNVSVSSKNGSVKQKDWSELCVFINSDVAARDEDTCIFVEKCSVKGNVKIVSHGSDPDTVTAGSSTSCSGEDLYSFLTADQVASILAAFPSGNKCGIKIKVGDPGKKSSITIKANDKDASAD